MYVLLETLCNLRVGSRMGSSGIQRDIIQNMHVSFEAVCKGLEISPPFCLHAWLRRFMQERSYPSACSWKQDHTVWPRNQKQLELTVGFKWLWTSWLWNSGGRGRRGPNMTVDLIRLCTSSGCGRGSHVAVVLKWLWTSHVRDPTKPKQIL